MATQFAVIGLGRFGSSLAGTLYEMGYEVLGIDSKEEKVQEMVNRATHVLQVDSTDEVALKTIGIRNFDVVIVAIGEDIQSSILTTLILKDLGVPRIVVKAQNELHGKVLEKIGADKIIYPERDMGIRVVHQLITPNILDYIELAPNYNIVEIAIGPDIVGKTLLELDIRAKFGLNVMAIKSNEQLKIAPQANDQFQEGDILVLVGHIDDIKRFEEYSNGKKKKLKI
ncbi:TrkA family potassium uptake protein [Tepidibacillus infernus]|uniref:Potassium uptake system protein n=1 Tax=Tepidibacillus decaturensis TaxID=1413211 RepID=A0A135L221_9BACI|nr:MULTISPECIES: TrkA family potassium uptake protein [Tepidibacillus]KXG42913.1 potassium uptake system protein [Tepidibacillus decaturensis]GBF12439.1 ktr system potassium uptake protein A [Tepidibacillus sp. HK-1]